jgi:hypothetical protein
MATDDKPQVGQDASSSKELSDQDLEGASGGVGFSVPALNGILIGLNKARPLVDVPDGPHLPDKGPTVL